MQVKQAGKRRYVVVIERGEEILGTLLAFLEERKIAGGQVTGLGAVRGVTLGFFDLEKKEYAKRTFEEPMELGNLVGLLGVADGKPFVHAHATVAGPEMIALTGHLMRAEVSIAVECVVTDFDEELPRILDPKNGLRMFRFDGGAEAAGEARRRNGE